MRHEVLRLGSDPQTPIACDVGDAAALVRIERGLDRPAVCRQALPRA